MHLGCTYLLGLHGCGRLYRHLSVASRLCNPSLTTLADVISHPIHYAWDRFTVDVQGHCINVDGFFIGSGVVNAVLNFVIFILVCPRAISSLLKLPTDAAIADPSLVPPSNNRKATNSPNSSVHLSWLVCSQTTSSPADS